MIPRFLSSSILILCCSSALRMTFNEWLVAERASDSSWLTLRVELALSRGAVFQRPIVKNGRFLEPDGVEYGNEGARSFRGLFLFGLRSF
jgi:hypothetical protein